MERNGIITKLLLCFLLSSLVLSSCGRAKNSDINLSENLSSIESNAENSENNSTEYVSESDISTDISKDDEQNASSNINENDIPYKNSEIYPGDHAKIIYGDDFPMTSYPLPTVDLGFTRNFDEFFSDTENDETFYYVCLDFRRAKHYKTDEEIRDYLKTLEINTEKIGEYVFVSYVTKNNLKSLKKSFNESSINERCTVYLADNSLNEEVYKNIRDGEIPLKPMENITFSPPENATVLYGSQNVPISIEAVYLSFAGLSFWGDEIKEYFDNPEYDGAYYYCCFDTRRSYAPFFTEEEELAYYASFGIKCEATENVLFAYVTEEQLKALENDKGLTPACQVIWVHENAKEEYIRELDWMDSLG